MQSMTGGARFEDLSYDGVMRNGRMIDGLGQITDSYSGPNDFELPDPLDTQGIIISTYIIMFTFQTISIS